MLAGIHGHGDIPGGAGGGTNPRPTPPTFAHLRDIVGFPDYYEAEKRYAAD